MSDAHLRLSRILIEHLSWQTEDYGVDFFSLDQYQQVAKIMRVIKGRAILSINDHPDIREVFLGLTTKELPITHTVGGGGSTPCESFNDSALSRQR